MKWVFRKEKYYGRGFNNETWPKEIDGMEVDFSRDKESGWCQGYSINKLWCEEIKEVGMKTWVHERAGVEPYENFQIKGRDAEFMFDLNGALRYGDAKEWSAYSNLLADILNDPSLIIHLPRLTPEQMDVLKALRVLGFEWVARDEDGTVYAYLGKPLKDSCSWHGTCHSPMKVINTHRALSSLVSWSDPSPLNISDALKGVE